MVREDDDFSSKEGTVFLLPYDGKDYVMAQVGFGGDLGVFAGLYGRQVDPLLLNPDVIFRVHFGRLSPRKFGWINIGMLPFKNGLDRPNVYVHRPIGSNESVLVAYGENDRIGRNDDNGSLEPLATWSHEHIIERFRRHSDPGRL